ncbi:L-rhamnose isomerase [Microbacter margulisiae]|uniref:L-rhamnose isomerase n=1 Tax=Microbacter margulisiae TaxID=1350067 RepID=A0A7W5DQ92_9PORP|nr:L-rhamnose isomerase [Microbacter margulisiae]MBB3187027.1 L-rhamnose isomerase [Microbacter margulisiae]
MKNTLGIEQKFAYAKEKYEAIGVDVDNALKQLKGISLSLHCWQTDDVTGFENSNAQLSGGIQATGNYPGKARSIDEVRQDIEKVATFLPGNHRLSLHAIYGDFGGKKVDRDQIEPEHFQSWIDWAKANNLKLDFNSTSFSHPKSGDQTLSHRDKTIRDFWIEHTIRSRRIADEMGKQLGSKACHNLWVHDGQKDMTVDRFLYRSYLKDSLDQIFAYKFENVKDSVECKLFGTGLESFTAGSHEFYMGYAVQNQIMATLDLGHFHPTEEIYDKISSLLLYTPELLLHVSRPVRWDSDHVVVLNESVIMLAQEIVRANALNRVNVGLDYFDASINRIGAYVIGARATQKAFLQALLEPINMLRKYEANGQYFERLALLEEAKALPWGDVYDYFCYINHVPVGIEFISEINEYEKQVTSRRI